MCNFAKPEAQTVKCCMNLRSKTSMLTYDTLCLSKVVYLFLRYLSVLSCVDTGSTINDLKESDSAESYCELTSSSERRPPTNIVLFVWAVHKTSRLTTDESNLLQAVEVLKKCLYFNVK